MELIARKKEFNRDIDLILLSILITISFSPKVFLIFLVYSFILFLRFLISFVYAKKYSGIQAAIIILFIFLFISSCIFYIKENSYYNALMYIVSAFHIYFFVFTYKNSDNIVISNLFKLFTYMIYFQCIVLFIDAFRHNFVPGDWAGGTIKNAHILGIMISVLLIKKFYEFIYLKKNAVKILEISILIISFWLTATNQAFFSTIVSIIIIRIFHSRHKFLTIMSSIILILFSFGFLSTKFGNLFRDIEKVPKVAGYSSLINLYKDEPLTLFIGTSIGTYSSRAAVSLSSGKYLAKPQGQQLPVVHTTNYIIKYFSSLYSPEFYEQLQNAGVTGTFYTPFSSILSIISEYGLIGILILIKIIIEIKAIIMKTSQANKCLYYSITTAFLSYIILFFYENWLEYPNAILPLILLLLLGITKTKNKKIVRVSL